MGHLVKITFKRDVDNNRVVAKKGMSVEFITGSNNTVNFGDLDKIADMFANKYGTKCQKGHLQFGDIDIEKVG